MVSLSYLHFYFKLKRNTQMINNSLHSVNIYFTVSDSSVILLHVLVFFSLYIQSTEKGHSLVFFFALSLFDQKKKKDFIV